MSDASRQTDPYLGRLVDGRFRLDRLLGQGGMGRVYSGVQTSVGRAVAIKLLRQDLTGVQTLEQRFFREAQILAKLRHPNIVGVVDFGRDEELDALYFAMDFIDGSPLSGLLEKGRVPLPLALEITRQICSGLAEAHAAGIVHRDLKPDNVMMSLTAEGRLTAQILDFGIALPTADETRFTSTGAVVGTPHYMSPEQAQDQPVDERSDLYAVGVMLFEMLTGRLPFVADTPMALLLKSVTQPPPRIEELLAADDVPPPMVVGLLYQLLAKDPADRPATAAALGLDLDSVMRATSAGQATFSSLEELSDAVVDRATDEVAFAETAGSGELQATPSEIARKTQIEQSASEQSKLPAPESAASDVAVPPDVATGRVADPEVGRPNQVLLVIGSACVLLGVVAVGYLAWGGGEEPAEDVDDHPPAVAALRTDAGSARERPEPPRVVEAAPDVSAPPQFVEAEPAPEAVRAPTKEEPSQQLEKAPKQLAAPKPGIREVEEEPAVVKNEPVPPTDDGVLSARILVHGGFCPKGQDCNFAPTASSVVCTGESDCTHTCAKKPKCTQTCESEADCTYRCPQGSCTQVCSGQSNCELSCAGGGCTQFCQDQADCRVSCSGGKCQQRAFGDQALMRHVD